MDIRNYFKKPRLNNEDTLSAGTSISENDVPALVNSSVANVSEIKKFNVQDVDDFDIGNFLRSSIVSDELKYKVVTHVWTPNESYDFKFDGQLRSFRFDWLKLYHPWLCYTKTQGGGALCKFCVIFKPTVHRGTQGGFIIKPFNKYKHLNEAARNHMKSSWHINALSVGTSFIKSMEKTVPNVINQIVTGRNDLINCNRLKLKSIISTIVFCGTHDIALRGNLSTNGNFRDLLQLRIEAGDSLLKNHLETSPKNARYTSVRTEHDIINICENIIANDIVKMINASEGFSILADETSDISGWEQLSFGVRFLTFVNEQPVIKEEFLGFEKLEKFDAFSISNAILNKCQNLNLNMNKCIGQGYDGCSTMAGKENGVKSIIQKKYPNIHFVHCSSHRLNLVVNDLNTLVEIRNCIGTMKEIIKFFRDSPLRRPLFPAVPMLCETRWSQKHKSARIFKENIIDILNKLFELSHGSNNGKEKAFRLYAAATTPIFFVSIFIIARYSSLLEPVTHKLQDTQINLLDVKAHIQTLLQKFNEDRNGDIFEDIYKKCVETGEQFDVLFKVPRITSKQTNRSNYNVATAAEYYKVAIFIPYLDSLISSLHIRFSDENEQIFQAFNIFPSQIHKFTWPKIRKILESVNQIFHIENLIEEGEIWFSMVKEKELSITETFEKAKFLPNIRKLLSMLYALPVSTATIERSFSTLRRVKTWLRSNMNECRLSGLSMLSVHRTKIEEMKDEFIDNVISEFAKNDRRMLFLFDE